MKDIDADYYGYRDDDDGILIPLEQNEERKAVAAVSDEDESHAVEEALQPRFIAHVPVPSQLEVKEALLRRKKQELLERYASETLQNEAEEAQDLLGVKTTSES
uniref:Uncharacterized protein n=1 Tax=Timema genevievae TaxID=629358 RepID=A0A7R9K4Z4_TIMGE|nr:unnamed protein product [Timema genevievae]